MKTVRYKKAQKSIKSLMRISKKKGKEIARQFKRMAGKFDIENMDQSSFHK